MNKLTAETITDGQIRALRCEPEHTQVAAEALGEAFAVHALPSKTERKARRLWARARCAEIINARDSSDPVTCGYEPCDGGPCEYPAEHSTRERQR